VLDANHAHVKALYRRGMAYMAAGDFEEARADFKMMMKVDKLSEADATAALLKLKQEEQEVEKKARKQFKGLFDKKPGEIAVAGSEDKEDNDTGENPNNFDKEDSDADNSEESREAEADADQMGWFSRIWPTGGRLFSALGLQRCSIL
ncbi:peptidyl-prolyl cis-trans isomerase pasticcino1, partial [Quercus suber]